MYLTPSLYLPLTPVQVRVEVVLELNLEEAYDVVNRRDNSLEDVLVLRVQGGADYFCAVSGVLDAATCEVVRKT
jgi:hypothetical protein